MSFKFNKQTKNDYHFSWSVVNITRLNVISKQYCSEVKTYEWIPRTYRSMLYYNVLLDYQTYSNKY